MSQARLLACPGCARHVRISESACPFCRAVLPESFGAGPAPRRPTARLSRAALYALGATSIGIAACSGGSGGSGGSDAETDTSADVGAVALYGATPTDATIDNAPPAEGGAREGGAGEGGVGDGSGGGDADSGALAAYGGFPMDSGSG